MAKTAIATIALVRFGPLAFSLAAPAWNGVPFAAAVGCLTRIPEAIETAREEKRRTESERVAFERFSERVRELDATDDRGAPVDGTLLRDPAGTAGDTTETVRELYRATVMSVDFYESEYGEPLLTNVAAELGPDFATALATTDTLDPPLQHALADASQTAAGERAELASLVGSELQSLTASEQRLRNAANAVDRVHSREFNRQAFEGLEDAARRLRTAERECDSLIADRQTEYVDAPQGGGLNFREYLYERHDWTHPVVGDALDLIRRVREVEERIAATVFDRE
ncbi:DUF7260 family protein [Halobellus ruber]|uniref:DUF7260 domain-containing protein n=1 Tax=Halobellus ruber TaxID=2761102 RepID=A0A7J9SH26_9EURY|nr:hypothetical protein [Halobellus ruber]MBB6646018.1 hypothetical protein [Halobellus ruber]